LREEEANEGDIRIEGLEEEAHEHEEEERGKGREEGEVTQRPPWHR
jgi:hypothetical protein